MKNCISFLLCAVLLFSSVCCASALTPGEPGLHDLEDIGYSKLMQLPKTRSYLSSYEDMFVKTDKANVYLYTKAGSSTIGDLLEYGDEVTAIAVQNGMTCVIYSRSDGIGRAGWITSSNLQYSEPDGAGASGADTGSLDISRPGLDVIKFYGEEKNIQLPKEESYFPVFSSMYVRTHKANVYSHTKAGSAKVVDTLEYCDEVTAIAVQKTMTCVLYETSNGSTHAGWITTDNLSYERP